MNPGGAGLEALVIVIALSFLILVGLILGQASVEREAIKLGVAHYRSDMHGDSKFTWNATQPAELKDQ